MSDTPRTDALLLEINEGRVYETVGPITELACALERELAEAHRVFSETVKERDEAQKAEIEAKRDWIDGLKRYGVLAEYAVAQRKAIQSAMVWLEAVRDELEDNSDTKDGPEGAPQPNIFMRLYGDQELAMGFLRGVLATELTGAQGVGDSASADPAVTGSRSEGTKAGTPETKTALRNEFETNRQFTITARVTEKERDPLYLGDELDEMAEEIDAAEDEPTPMMKDAKKLHDELRHQSCTNKPDESGCYVHEVPDRCDRIVWRGYYYHLPETPTSEFQVNHLGDVEAKLQWIIDLATWDDNGAIAPKDTRLSWDSVGRMALDYARAALIDLRTVACTKRPEPTGCEHKGAPVEFDPVAAKGLSDREIRQRWPRFDGPCPDCGARLIKYASREHYVMGDW